MSYKVEYFGSNAEWLNNRGLGGSSAAAILNKNPYLSLMELYNSIKFGRKKEKEKSNEILEYGHKAEPLIRKIFELNFKYKYKVFAPKNNEMYRCVEYPEMTATLDGRLEDIVTKEKGILEIKTHDIKNSQDLENWNNHIPDNYFAQLLHYFIVMDDYSFAWLVAKLKFYKIVDGARVLDREEIRYYFIKRSEVEKEIAYLKKKEIEFIENTRKGIMPTVKI